jgi:hypothetical protein
MRYELSDKEWSFIRAMLPTKRRGVPASTISASSMASSGCCDLAGPANHLWSSNHLLQSVRSLAKGRHLGRHPEGADAPT